MSKPAEIIAARIIEQINKGVSPWARPWRTTGQVAPRNGISGRPYSGMNFFVLAMMGYKSPNWFTFKSADSVGAQVKKGEKGTPVCWWNFIENKKAKTKEEQKKKIPLLRYYVVFNEDQIENLPEKYVWKPLVIEGGDITGECIPAADKAISEWGLQVPHIFGGDMACYSPMTDNIRMPKRKNFKTFDLYYQTFFHEMGHSTGHSSRLNREGVTSSAATFGSKEYAREELIAELTASLAGEHFQFDVQGNDAAYLKSWIGSLENDPQEIMRAASKAQKAFNMLIGKQEKEENETEENEEAQKE